MKIAYILADPGIGLFGTKGASVHAQEMIRAFRRLGHEVTAYCLKRGNKADDAGTEFVPEDLRSLPVVTVSVAGAKGAPERELAVLRAASRIAAGAAEDGAELIYERYSLFSDAGAQAARQLRAAGRPASLVVEVNTPLAAEQRAHRSLHHERLAEQMTVETFAAADLLSCVSALVAEWAQGQLPADHTGTRVAVTPNGVDAERFSPNPPHGARTLRPPVTVGFLGTLKPWHGVETLLESFAAAVQSPPSDWRLEIIGDGPQRQALEQLVSELGIRGQVVFRGALPPVAVPDALSRVDVAVAPYPDGGDHYFSPLKVYEYMAAGLPTVASAVGELPALLNNAGDPAGLLVPPGDRVALAEALSQLAGEPALRRALGHAARSAAQTKHSWTARAEDVLEAAGLEELMPL